MLPLHGVRVLDLSRLLPGPWCSLLLADLGADVVKVEAPAGGDYIRWMPPLKGAQSGYFHALNRNKRSIALDLKRPEGRDAFLALVGAGYDVVLESFRPGVMDRLGLGYEALKAASPRVILCSISGYGQDGPMRDRAGHDLNYIGLAGVLGLTGAADGPPVVPGVQIGDVGGGALPAAVGILAALFAREQTGKGRWIDVSMTEGALAFLAMHLGARSAMDRPLARGREMLSGTYPCYAVYGTKDGKHMSLGALEPHFWQRFCEAVGREDLASDGLASGEEGARVRAAVADVFASRTQAEWVAFFAAVDVCCEPVLEGDALFEDPQHVARETFFEIEDPEDGPVRQVASPVRFVGGEPAPRRPAPKLGADSDAVLESAGFDAAAREKLRASGIVV
jgi:alpha-methylacyl-CoA racemase